MRIAVFGGTFDPPHLGHLNLAKNVLSHYFADQILFIPSASPPHKKSKDITSFNHRVNMLDILVGENENFKVSTIEEERLPELSFTVETMRVLKKRNPVDEFYLLIGGDSCLNLHSWCKANELVAENNFLVYPRPDSYISYDNLLLNWDEGMAKKLFESQISLPLKDISSSEIRKKIHLGTDVSCVLSDGVYEYIKANSLYS